MRRQLNHQNRLWAVPAAAPARSCVVADTHAHTYIFLSGTFVRLSEKSTALFYTCEQNRLTGQLQVTGVSVSLFLVSGHFLFQRPKLVFYDIFVCVVLWIFVFLQKVLNIQHSIRKLTASLYSALFLCSRHEQRLIFLDIWQDAWTNDGTRLFY